MVEDACLLDDEEVQYDDCQECPEVHAEGVGHGDIDAIVNHITADWEDVVGKQESRQKSSPTASPLLKGVDTQLKSPIEGELSSVNPLLGFGAATSHPIERPSVTVGKNRSRELLKTEKRNVLCASSCPPTRARLTSSGPWSLDWVNKQKRLKGGGPILSIPTEKANFASKNAPRLTRKKGNDSLRHCAQSLKCIARLSDKDRKEVLRVLQRSERKRNTVTDGFKLKGISSVVSASNESQTSVNNDWGHWLLLHGNEKKKFEDVCEIGKVVGLQFVGDTNNMFDVLSGKGRIKQGVNGEDA